MIKPGMGVVIGRFQVPELHAGHVHIIEHALAHQKTLVLIGVHANGVSSQHPLDYATRAQMIQEDYPSVMVCPVRDMPTNEGWTAQVDTMIATHAPFASKVQLYAGRDSFKDSYSGGYPVQEIDPIDDHLSGTDVRDRIAETPLNTYDFRAGVIYASRAVFPRVKSTVDVAVMREQPLDINSSEATTELQVLLVRKPAEDGWRFPGGFLAPKDATRRAAARRELFEETGLLVGGLKHIGDCKVRDWRDTEDECIHTDLYSAEYLSGGVTLKDDLAGGDYRWQPVDMLDMLIYAGDHRNLAQTLSKDVGHDFSY